MMDWGCSSEVEHWPSMFKDLGLSPAFPLPPHTPPPNKAI